jgi:RHH-type transcriptional regulator, proline utilization regulon repressor / proline dehydrogenase / delta 1-pyrroline-5-carboxylate dehydrogenase
MNLFGLGSRRPSKAHHQARHGEAKVVPEYNGDLGEVEGFEERVREIGEALLGLARARKAGVLSARFYQDKLMDWSMKDPAFKVQLFRFVDAFPVLRTPELVHGVLSDYMSQPGVKTPPGMDLGLRAGGIAKGLVAGTMSKQITSMASNFIAGTDARDALPTLEKLWEEGLAFSVDLLGEACVSDDEADGYREKYLDLVTNLPEKVRSWEARPMLERDHLGVVPRTNVSVKVSSLCAQFDPIAPERAIGDLMSRLEIGRAHV